MNECRCGTKINYPPPCVVCERRAEQEALKLKPLAPGEARRLSPDDPRLFNIPNTDQNYQL